MAQETFRKSNRHLTKQRVRCKTARGGSEAVWMLDLSPTGCQVQLQYGRLKVGERVVVHPHGLEGISGAVRWVKASNGGIEFTSPLHPSVADHLAKATFIDDDTARRSVFGTANSLGRRLLPPPTSTIVRSVA